MSSELNKESLKKIQESFTAAKKKQVGFTVPMEVWKKVKRYSEKNNLTMSAVLDMAVRDFICKKEGK